MARGIHQSLSSASSEIRLLTLLPSPTFSSAIECILENTMLGKATQTYNAVSYAWGDPNKTILISVNGIDVYVNNSLAAALRYIRHATEPIVLWADAICINQEDDSEKNHQVQIMRGIYSAAVLVIAWLGEPSNDSDLAMDIVANPPEYFGSEESDESDNDTTSEEKDNDDDITSGEQDNYDDNNDESDGGSLVEVVEDDDDENKWTVQEEEIDENVGELDNESRESDWETDVDLDNGRTRRHDSVDRFLLSSSSDDDDHDGSSTDSDSYLAYRPPEFLNDPTVYSPQELQAVQSLLQRSWWGRLWVVQEAWLAKKLVFKCGHKEVSVKMFLAWAQLWLTGYGLPADGQYFPGLIQIGTVLSSAEQEQEEEKEPEVLIQLLRNFASRATSMPEDRVYALLSLAGDAEEYGPPDYTKRAEEIYTQVALVTLKLMDSLEILHYAGINNSAGCVDMDLPSWIPNWTRSFVYDMWGSFDASLGREPKYEVSQESHILVVEGLIYDTVLTSKPITHVGLGEVPIWEEFLPRNKPQLYKTGIPQIQAIFRTILLDTDMLPGNKIDINREEFFDILTTFLCELGANGPTQEPAQEDICLEINCSKYIDNLLEWIKESRDGRSDQEVLSLFLNDNVCVESYFNWLEEKDTAGISKLYSFYRTVRNIIVGTTGRKIFQTDRSLLGNAQVGIEQGDLVCILLGCATPVLLRQVESQYILLGPCFVLGLMNVEAIHELDDQKVHLQKFAIS